ncbi:MAG: cyclase family protein [bacterium]|nr:cyclase family protein [bacterium]
MKYIDLTHSFIDSMPAFPGDPQASLRAVANIKDSGYTDHELKSYMHVGTHMDAPLHMIADGKKMDEWPIEQFFGPGVVLDVRGKQRIDAPVLDGVAIERGSILFLYTGYGSLYQKKAYFDNQPTVSEDFAKRVVELGVKILGMDILGPDQPPFPTHKMLLGNGVLIIENLVNLEQLLDIPKFDVIALPMKLRADAAPVRVVAVVR